MRKILYAAALAALTMCASATWGEEVKTCPPGQTCPPITVEQAIAIAFENSPDLRIAADQLRKSKGLVAETKANFYPRFNAQVQETYQGPPVTLPIEGTTQTLVPSFNTVGTVSTFLPLDISNKLHYTTDIAEYQFQIDYLGLVTASEQLIFGVKAAYYNLLRACGQRDVAQAAVDVAVARLKDTQAKFDAGTVAKFDVTRSQVEVQNLNQDLLIAANRAMISQSVLNRTMGIDVNSSTTVTKPNIAMEPVTVDIPARIKDAYVNRPELKAGSVAINQAQTNVRLQKTGLAPTLNLNGNVDVQSSSSGFTPGNMNWIISATIAAPIWDAGITKARVYQARADVSKSQDTLTQSQLRVAQEVRNAALTLQEAGQRLKTTADGVALAEEALRLASVRYDAGIATLVEVTDAESALTQAKFNNVAAQFDYAIALADLQRSTGMQPELTKLQLLGPKPVTL